MNSESKAMDQDQRSIRLAGISIFGGAVWLNISMIVAEALIPNYSVSREYIADSGCHTSREPAPQFQPV